MTVKIYVNENRTFSGAGRGFSFGTTFENDVTTLKFVIPESLSYLTDRYLLLASGSDTFKLNLNSSGEVVIPQYVTTQENLQIQLVLKDVKSSDIWRSATYDATFYSSLDEGHGDPIEVAKNQQREVDRLQLSEALTQLTENDLSDRTWEELIEKTKELPLKSEQNVLDLTNYSALTYAFEHATTAPSLLTGGYKLDREDPDDSESAEVLIKLPYLNTKNVTNFGAYTPISNEVEECSFDISSSPNTNTQYNQGMFQNGRANLHKLGLTGVERINSLNGMFHDSVLEEIALYVDGEFIVPTEAYRTDFYRDVFLGCRSLKNIIGDPLDMSVTTTYPATFKNCQSLQYVRFKPKTINGDLDLSDCPALIKGKYEASSDDPGTLISIVNGVRDYSAGMNQITIKFSIFVKGYLTSWRCVKDDETGLYVASTQGMTLATVLTNKKGVVIA